jgi:hypothetical protein
MAGAVLYLPLAKLPELIKGDVAEGVETRSEAILLSHLFDEPVKHESFQHHVEICL